MGAGKPFSGNWAETKYGKVYLFTSQGPKSVTAAELQLRKAPAGLGAALLGSCCIQRHTAGEASHRWNSGSQNLFKDKWHCDFPWHPLKFLTNFQKYLMFALKQPVGLRHFSWKHIRETKQSQLPERSESKSARPRRTTYLLKAVLGRQAAEILAKGNRNGIFSLHSPPSLFCSCLSDPLVPARGTQEQRRQLEMGQTAHNCRAWTESNRGRTSESDFVVLKLYGRGLRLMRMK